MYIIVCFMCVDSINTTQPKLEPHSVHPTTFVLPVFTPFCDVCAHFMPALFQMRIQKG